MSWSLGASQRARERWLVGPDRNFALGLSVTNKVSVKPKSNPKSDRLGCTLGSRYGTSKFHDE